MIRDPSDGSVREKPAPHFAASHKSGERDPPVMLDQGGAGAVLKTSTSGLQTGSQKPKYQADLERSREQLKRYHETGKWDHGASSYSQAAKGLRPDGQGLEQPGDSHLAGDQSKDG